LHISLACNYGIVTDNTVFQNPYLELDLVPKGGGPFFLGGKEVWRMFKKQLFCTDLTDYCGHVFNHALNMAIKGDARLWIYHGLGRLHLSEKETTEKIKSAETRVVDAYVGEMKKRGFEKYVINVSDGDVVTEITRLARNAKIDIIFMGPSTKEPVAMGEQVRVAPLGPVVSEAILWAPCPVMIIPPAMLPGLTRR